MEQQQQQQQQQPGGIVLRGLDLYQNAVQTRGRGTGTKRPDVADKKIHDGRDEPKKSPNTASAVDHPHHTFPLKDNNEQFLVAQQQQLQQQLLLGQLQERQQQQEQLRRAAVALAEDSSLTATAGSASPFVSDWAQPQPKALYSTSTTFPPTPAWLLRQQPQLSNQYRSLSAPQSGSGGFMKGGTLSRQTSLLLEDILAASAPPPPPPPPPPSRQASLILDDFLSAMAPPPPAPPSRQASLVLFEDCLAAMAARPPPPLSREPSRILEDFLSVQPPPPPSRQTSLMLVDFLAAMASPPPPCSRQTSLGLQDLLAMVPPSPAAAGRHDSRNQHQQLTETAATVPQSFFKAMMPPPGAGLYGRSQSSESSSNTIPKAVFVSHPQFNHAHPSPVQQQLIEIPVLAPPQPSQPIVNNKPAAQFSLSEQLYLVRERRLELLRQEREKQKEQDHQKQVQWKTSDKQEAASTTTTDSSGHRGGLLHSPRAAGSSPARRTASTSALNNHAANTVQHTPTPSALSYSKTAPLLSNLATAASRTRSVVSVSSNESSGNPEKFPGTWSSPSLSSYNRKQEDQPKLSGWGNSGPASTETNNDLLYARGRKLREQLQFHQRLEQVGAAACAQNNNNNPVDVATTHHQLQLLSARTKDLQQQLMYHNRLEAAAATGTDAGAGPTGQSCQPSAPAPDANLGALYRNQTFPPTGSSLTATGVPSDYLQQHLQQYLHHGGRVTTTTFPPTATHAPFSTNGMMATHQGGGASLPMLPCNAAAVDGNTTATMHKRLLANYGASFSEQVSAQHQQQQDQPCFNKRRKMY